MAAIALISVLLLQIIQILSAQNAAPYEALTKRVTEYSLPPLRHGFDDFEPFIDGKTMRVHITGHHEAYKTNTNKGLQSWREDEPDNDLAKESIMNIMMNLDKVPEKHNLLFRNHGGGFINHCLYFGTLSPNNGNEPRKPTGALLEDIEESFGSYDSFTAQFSEKAKKHFGSGYVWLVRDPRIPEPNLMIQTTVNQDSPVSAGFRPIMVIDLWEHAYYLKHNYKRADHIKDFWMVVDWGYAAELDTFWTRLEKEDSSKKQEL